MNDSSKEKLITQLTLFISIGLFVFSLSQECFCTENDCGGNWSGLAILFSGTLGFFVSPAGFTWLANPAILIAWIYVKKNPKKSLKASAIAAFFSVSFLFFRHIVSDESGGSRTITAYHLGYWLWLASIMSMLLSNLLFYFRSRSLVSHNNATY